MIRPSHHSRGFAVVISLAMTGLLAVVMLILTRSMAADLSRTAKNQIQQQLDEMLLAAQVVVRENLAASPTPTSPALTNSTGYSAIVLPTGLQQAHLAYRIAHADAAEIQVAVVAQLGRATAGQNLVYQKTGTAWFLHDATLLSLRPEPISR
jgi:Tfp pilus assembly protein PilX